MKCKILISGAGLAGPLLAYWLNKYGFETTIVERSNQLRTGGNGVDIRGLAVDVVKKTGLWPIIKSRAIDMNGMVFVNENGKPLSRINIKAMQSKNKSEEVEIYRGELSELLYTLTKDHTEYIFGDSIRQIEQTTAGAAVMFEKAKGRTFDLVIGADGIHSNVRNLVFGPEPDYLNYKNHYYAFSSVDSSLGVKGWLTGYNTPGKFAGISMSNNMPGAKVYFAFRQNDQLIYDYRDTEQQKLLLKNAFSGMGWKVPELLEQALSNEEFYFDCLSQVVMPSWSKGRVALVGDAAFCASPVTGAGATLSIVGAYELAGKLHQAKGDYAAAFKNYEQGYRKVVEKSQSELFTGLLVPKTRLGIWTRNTLSKLPIMGALASMERKLNSKNNPVLTNYQ
jgi:2-polyprenyl-6-methoxyphenol hydroxylase-like FAD-dependent oxidoreductase